jgi:hypothetical protein
MVPLCRNGKGIVLMLWNRSRDHDLAEYELVWRVGLPAAMQCNAMEWFWCCEIGHGIMIQQNTNSCEELVPPLQCKGMILMLWDRSRDHDSAEYELMWRVGLPAAMQCNGMILMLWNRSRDHDLAEYELMWRVGLPAAMQCNAMEWFWGCEIGHEFMIQQNTRFR